MPDVPRPRSTSVRQRVAPEVRARAEQLASIAGRSEADGQAIAGDELPGLFVGLSPGQQTDLLFSGCPDPETRQKVAAALGLEARLDLPGIYEHPAPREPRFLPVRESINAATDGIAWSSGSAVARLKRRLRTGDAKGALDLLFALPLETRRVLARAYQGGDGPVDLAACSLRRDLVRWLSGRDRLVALAYWDNGSGRLEIHDELALFLLRLPSHRQILRRLAALSPGQQEIVDEALRAIHAAPEAGAAGASPVRRKVDTAKAALYPEDLASLTRAWSMRMHPAARSKAKLLLRAPRDEGNHVVPAIRDAAALHAALRGGPGLKPQRKSAFQVLERAAFSSPDGLAKLCAAYEDQHGTGRFLKDLERLRSRRTPRWGERLDDLLRAGEAPDVETRRGIAARYAARTARQAIEGQVSDRALLDTFTLLVDLQGSGEPHQPLLEDVERAYAALLAETSGTASASSAGILRRDMQAASRPRPSSKAIFDLLLGRSALSRAEAAAIVLHDTLHNDDRRSWLTEKLGARRVRRQVFEMLDLRALPAESRAGHVRATERVYEARYGADRVPAKSPSTLREEVLARLGRTVAGGSPSEIARLFEQGQLRPGDRLYHAIHDTQAPPGRRPLPGNAALRFVRALPRRLLGVGGPNVARAWAEYGSLALAERKAALEVYAEERSTAEGATPDVEPSFERGKALLADTLAALNKHRARDLCAQLAIDLARLSRDGAGDPDDLREKIAARLKLHRGRATSRFMIDLLGPQGKELEDLERRVAGHLEAPLAQPARGPAVAPDPVDHLVDRMDRLCERKEKIAQNARRGLAAVIAITLFSAKTAGVLAIPLVFAPLVSISMAALLAGARAATLGAAYGSGDLANDIRVSAGYILLAQINPKLPLTVGAASVATRIVAGQLPGPRPRIAPEVLARLPPTRSDEQV